MNKVIIIKEKREIKERFLDHSRREGIIDSYGSLFNFITLFIDINQNNRIYVYNNRNKIGIYLKEKNIQYKVIGNQYLNNETYNLYDKTNQEPFIKLFEKLHKNILKEINTNNSINNIKKYTKILYDSNIIRIFNMEKFVDIFIKNNYSKFLRNDNNFKVKIFHKSFDYNNWWISNNFQRYWKNFQDCYVDYLKNIIFSNNKNDIQSINGNTTFISFILSQNFCYKEIFNKIIQPEYNFENYNVKIYIKRLPIKNKGNSFHYAFFAPLYKKVFDGYYTPSKIFYFSNILLFNPQSDFMNEVEKD